MKDEYIIINKTTIQKRIEELKKPIAHYDGIYVSDTQRKEYETLEEIISQSTPLIPIVEDCYDKGSTFALRNTEDCFTDTYEEVKQNYISNLKLNYYEKRR